MLFLCKQTFTGACRLSGFVIALLFWQACATEPLQTGLDQKEELHALLRQQRVGIITNQTGYSSAGEHIIDVISSFDDVTVAALFGPEHGFRGAAEAGAKIDTGLDVTRNLPVYSLYGVTRKPTPEMLADIDVLVFDIQDIGARFYTYIYTMALAMEAAAVADVRFVVLDRPNPITGTHVEGNILEPDYATFVGLYPIPVRHGMTIAELARMFNEEGWLSDSVKAKIEVLPMRNWRRGDWYDDTGLAFRKPSPNMPTLATATVYPGLCLLEGTNVSEGRGTHRPFELFGAPWINSDTLCKALNALQLPGVQFLPAGFLPVSIPGVATNPKYANRDCFGAEVQVTHRNEFEPYWTGIQIVNTIQRLYPDSLNWRPRGFDRLAGTGRIRTAISQQQDLRALRLSWQDELERFAKIRARYLLY